MYFRQSVWELPKEEIEVKKKELPGIQRTERRAEFKLNVSNFAAKRMEPHRKQLFSNNDNFCKFLRKVSSALKSFFFFCFKTLVLFQDFG